MIRALINLLTGGVLDRVLDTVDRKVQSSTDREKIKGDIIKEHMRTRAGWMKSGGFITLMVLLVPTAYHYAAVSIYSVHWCKDCHAAKDWTIAALPEPLDQYQGWIILAAIGGLSLLTGLRK